MKAKDGPLGDIGVLKWVILTLTERSVKKNPKETF
jgi:hypothetical protein